MKQTLEQVASREVKITLSLYNSNILTLYSTSTGIAGKTEADKGSSRCPINGSTFVRYLKYSILSGLVHTYIHTIIHT